jgi:hypothetical protein
MSKQLSDLKIKGLWKNVPRYGLSLLVGQLVLGLSLAGEHDARRLAVSTVRADQLMTHVDTLADDAFEGREAGQRGGRAAAKYLLQYLHRYLQPAGGSGGFAQLFGRDYQNLLGVLNGSDPKLSHEFILVGAHYDHVGYGNHTNSNGPVGYIHNGADDNASGTAALLEVVEAVAHLDQPPKRSILFALWDGEEKGLLGSEHWVSWPTVPLRDVKLVMNMDMVGRLGNKPVEVIGTRSAAGLRHMVSQANQSARLPIHFPWAIEDNSDHHTFFRRGIPILMVHTGLHKDYHTPRDDAHLIDSQGLHAVTRLTLDILLAVANEPVMPGYRPTSQFEKETHRQHFEAALPNPAPRLGVSWKPRTDSDHAMVEVSRVAVGSPAEQAGITVGDRILAINDVPLRGAELFQAAVLEAASPARMTLERPGRSEPIQTTVSLAGRPARIGISWRENDAEPGTITIVRVVPGSPAHRAGMRIGDRVFQVDGQSFSDGNRFQAMMQSHELPIDFGIERQGIVFSVSMSVTGSAEIGE